MMNDILFYCTAALMVASALIVVFNRNIFNSAVFLGISFLGFGMLFMLLGADLVGVVQILIYAGAVTMLLMFVIMLTRPEYEVTWGLKPWLVGRMRAFTPKRRLAAVLVLVIFLTLVFQFFPAAWKVAGAVPGTAGIGAEEVSVAHIGELLLTQFVVPFEVVSLLLLVALLGAVILGRTDEAPAKSPAERAADLARKRSHLSGEKGAGKARQGGGGR